MTTRRKFLQISAAALPALALWNRNAFAGERIPIGLQLYTVRDLAEHDLSAVLKQIHEIGYREVEAYGGSYTRPPHELRSMIQDAGLHAPSGHFDFDGISAKFDYAKELGLDWMVCPMIPQPHWSLEGFQAAAKQFNEWGRRAKSMGMRFAFHNHDYEFRDFGGKTGYDVLISETDPDLVFFEMDCYWIAQSGRDPVQMMERLGHRARMIHLKDRKAGFPASTDMGPSSSHFEPVGEGNLQWKAVLAAAQRLQVEHYFVEQDNTYGHPIESIRSSYQYLSPLLP